MMGVVVRLSFLVGALIVLLHAGQIVSVVMGQSVNTGQVQAAMHQAVQALRVAGQALGGD